MNIDLLLAILGATIVVNGLLIAATLLQSRRERSPWAEAAIRASPRTTDSRGAHRGPTGRTQPGDGDQRDDRRIAAAVEAFVAGVSADAAGLARQPTPAEVLARRREIGGGKAAVATTPAGHVRAAKGRLPDARSADAVVAGLADAASWERVIRDEAARAARFNRPSTVVTASLHQLDDVAEHLGRDVAEGVVADTASLLESESRAIDRVARLGDARIGILLPETDEQGASRYTERVGALADARLAAAGVAVRLEFAWATVFNGDANAAGPLVSGASRRAPG